MWLLDRHLDASRTDRIITGFAQVMGAKGADGRTVDLVDLAESRREFDRNLEQSLMWEQERAVLLRMAQ